MSSQRVLVSVLVPSSQLSQQWWWMCTTLLQTPHHPVVDLRRLQSAGKRLWRDCRESWHLAMLPVSLLHTWSPEHDGVPGIKVRTGTIG